MANNAIYGISSLTDDSDFNSIPKDYENANNLHKVGLAAMLPFKQTELLTSVHTDVH